MELKLRIDYYYIDLKSRILFSKTILLHDPKIMQAIESILLSRFNAVTPYRSKPVGCPSVYSGTVCRSQKLRRCWLPDPLPIP